MERFRPRQVLLFGSYADGVPTADSDVDLLVTMQTSLRPVEQAVAIRAAAIEMSCWFTVARVWRSAVTSSLGNRLPAGERRVWGQGR